MRERQRRGDVLAAPVLVLNRYYAPVCVTTARRALVLLYGGSAHALDDSGEALDFESWAQLPVRDHDDRLPVVGGGLRVPRVLQLTRFDRTPRVAIRLTRRNLLLRDQYQCQYCGRKPGLRELNVDHVMPRSRGGQDTWENLVISCRRCNLVKGHRTPEEAAMALRREPRKPRWTTTAHILLSTVDTFDEWQPWLKVA